LIAWQRRHGRHDLPWQADRDPYRIWLSEVMLQQTRVAAVAAYFQRFVARFPDVRSLARARERSVLALWSGLGYYQRARNLLQAARLLVARHGGRLPRSPEALATLPGLGRSSAAAIAALAFGRRAAILDGNVRRVLARCFGVEGFPGERALEARLWNLAEKLVPRRGVAAYTQALMDLGATLCTRARPRCGDCPLRRRCVARRTDRVAVLPAPRPRRGAPQREASWLVLRSAGKVLLARRPASGLWGGLWSFPELGAEDPRAYCRRVLGREPESVRALARVAHAFTHFRLVARPYLCEARLVPHRSLSAGQLIWLDQKALHRAPLPAPVRQLIESLPAVAAGSSRPSRRRESARSRARGRARPAARADRPSRAASA
jgi:A/G-specific adenine glycosylase